MNDASSPALPPSPADKIEHILIATSFSQTSVLAAQTGAALALRLGARVTWVHVMEPVPVFAPEMCGMVDDFSEQRRSWAKASLEKWQGDHPTPAGSAVELLEGRSWERLVAFASESKADLIVMGSGAGPGVFEQLAGTTAELVVRHAPCPVLVMRGEAGALPQGRRRVLLSTDFSPASLAAFPWAEAAARLLDMSVTLTHVQQPLGLPGTREYAWFHDQIDALRKEADDRLANCRREHLDPALEVEVQVVEGTPHHELCRLVTWRNAALLVMSTHGISGWRRSLIGSTTERVVRNVTCPVLVIPSPAR